MLRTSFWKDSSAFGLGTGKKGREMGGNSFHPSMEGWAEEGRRGRLGVQKSTSTTPPGGLAQKPDTNEQIQPWGPVHVQLVLTTENTEEEIKYIHSESSLTLVASKAWG